MEAKCLRQEQCSQKVRKWFGWKDCKIWLKHLLLFAALRLGRPYLLAKNAPDRRIFSKPPVFLAIPAQPYLTSFSWFMVGAEGFEPSNGGTKTRCLTAWRRPNNALLRN